MSYQFIIISATEERKQKMEEQFAALELKSQINKHYLEASMISNSTEYSFSNTPYALIKSSNNKYYNNRKSSPIIISKPPTSSPVILSKKFTFFGWNFNNL